MNKHLLAVAFLSLLPLLNGAFGYVEFLNPHVEKFAVSDKTFTNTPYLYITFDINTDENIVLDVNFGCSQTSSLCQSNGKVEVDSNCQDMNIYASSGLQHFTCSVNAPGNAFPASFLLRWGSPSNPTQNETYWHVKCRTDIPDDCGSAAPCGHECFASPTPPNHYDPYYDTCSLNWDSAGPNLSASPTSSSSWTQGSVYVDISATEASGTDIGNQEVKYKVIRAGNTCDFSNPDDTNTCSAGCGSCCEVLGFKNIEISQDGNWYICVQGADVLGNTSTQTFGPYLVDNTPPDVNLYAPKPGCFPDLNVEVVWDYNLKGGSPYDHSEVDCNGDGTPEYTGTDTNYTCVYSSSGNHTVTVEVYDQAGNAGSSSVDITVDNVPPEIHLDPNGSDWALYVDVNIYGTDNLGVHWISYYDTWDIFSPCNDYNVNYSGTSEGYHIMHLDTTGQEKKTICAYAIDNCGNYSPITHSNIYMLDAQSPTISGQSASPYLVKNGQDVNITVYLNDGYYSQESFSHVTVYFSSIGGADTNADCVWKGDHFECLATGTVNTTDGDKNIEIHAVDKAGNETDTYETITVDNTPPQVTIISPDSNVVGTTDVNMVWDVNDPHYDHSELYCNGTDLDYNGKDTNYVCHYPGEGTYNPKLVVCDALANCTTISAPLVVDMGSPVIQNISVSGPHLDYPDFAKNGETVTVTFDVNEPNLDTAWVDFSTIAGMHDPITVANCTKSGSVYHCSASHTVYYASDTKRRVLYVDSNDLAGNQTGETTTVAIDNNGPVITSISPTSSDWTPSVTVNVTAEDVGDENARSGVKYIMYDLEPSSQGYSGVLTPVPGSSASIQINEDGNWHLFVRALDNVDNLGPITEVGYYLVDTTDPQVFYNSQGYTQRTWVNHSVWLYANVVDPTVNGVSSGISEKKYLVVDQASPCPGDTSSYSDLPGDGNVEVDSSGEEQLKLCVYAKDNAGNEYFSRYEYIYIDKVGPSVSIISPSQGAWAGESVEVDWRVNNGNGSDYDRTEVDCDGDGLPEYTGNELNGSFLCSYSSEGDYNIVIRGYDGVGNMGENRVLVHVDLTPPAVSASPDHSDWVNSPVDVDLTMADWGSGASTLYYMWHDSDDCPDFGYSSSNSSTSTTSPGFTGSWYICVYAEDNVGNMGDKEAFGPYLIDTTDPTVDIETPGYTPGTWSGTDVEVDITAQDGESGVHWLHFGSDTNLDKPCSDFSYVTQARSTGSMTVGNPGEVSVVKVCAYAEDYAGNAGDYDSTIVKVDEEDPQIAGVSFPGYTLGTWTNQDVTMDVNVVDGGEIGWVRAYDNTNLLAECTENGGLYSCDISQEGEMFVSVKAEDVVGNQGAAGTYPVKIDKTAPSINVISPGNNSYFGVSHVDINVEASDALSGVEGVRARVDGGSWVDLNLEGGYWVGTLDVGEGTHTLEFKGTDQAGNEGARSVTVTVDTTPPSVQITSPSYGSVETEEVDVGWDYNEDNYDHSWVDCNGDGTPEYVGPDTEYACQYDQDGDYIISVRVYDRGGLFGEAEVKVYARPGAHLISIPAHSGVYVGFEYGVDENVWASVLEGKKVKFFQNTGGKWEEVREVKGLLGYYILNWEDEAIRIPFRYTGSLEPVTLEDGWNLISVVDSDGGNNNAHREPLTPDQTSLSTIWGGFDKLIDPETGAWRDKDSLNGWLMDYTSYWIDMNGEMVYSGGG